MSEAYKTAKTETRATHEDEGRVQETPMTDYERDQIRRRARAIWREEGCPTGRDREHWAMAELQVLKSGLRP